MNTFIDRLFNQRAKRFAGEKVLQDPIKTFFKYLIDLGINSNRLKLIESQIENFQFPEDYYIADLCITNFYLELENYLINYDSRYINTKEKLRLEIKQEFPLITNKKAFLPLYHYGKNQELILSRVFLLVILKKFRDEDPDSIVTKAWMQALESDVNMPPTEDLVKQINDFRKIKDDSYKINKEFGNIFGQDFVDSVFKSTKEEFYTYYRRLPSVSCIADVVPQLFTSLLNDTIPTISLEPFTDSKTSNPEENGVLTTQITSILENLLDGYLLFKSSGIILDCNELACNIFGYSRKEFIKLSIYDLLPEDLIPILKEDIDTLYITENKIIDTRVEADITTRYGHTSNYEMSFSNNFSTPEESFTLLIKNISNREDNLKAKVSAERAAMAKATFLSNMSHARYAPR